MSDELGPGSAGSSVPALTEGQKKYLLHLAREAIVETIAPAPPEREQREERTLTEELQGLSEIYTGVFVSLHINESLRGCIGYVDGLRALLHVIPETASAAALRDPRFEPVREDELDKIDIEISVLSPLEKISGPDEITVGTHGLLVRCGKQQGLLLPQVAPRAALDAQAFLEHTCMKAGLRHDAWKEPDTEIFRFSAEVFGEKSSKDQAIM